MPSYLSPVDASGRVKICIMGPSTKFFSGLSAYTICLANALSKSNNVSVALLRNSLPRFLYPGKRHVGRRDYLLDFASEIRAYDGLDWNSPLSWIGAYLLVRRQEPEVIIVQWWTSSVVHMQLFLAIANRLGTRAKLILEVHEIVDPPGRKHSSHSALRQINERVVGVSD